MHGIKGQQPRSSPELYGLPDESVAKDEDEHTQLELSIGDSVDAALEGAVHVNESRCSVALAWYCDFVARAPVATCSVMLLVSISLCMLPSFIYCGSKMLCSELVHIEFSIGSDMFQVRGNEVARREEALDAADCGFTCHSATATKSTTRNGQEVVVAYVAADGATILEEARLAQALFLERQVSKYLGKPIRTQLRSFFPNYPNLDGALVGSLLQQRLQQLADEHQKNKSDGISTSSSPEEFEGMWPAYDNEFSSCSPDSRLLSSTFKTPATMDLQRKTFLESLPSIASEDLYVTFWPEDEFWFVWEREAQVLSDLRLLGGVSISAFLFLVLVTRSILLAALGFLSMNLASGIAFCMYRIVISKFFGLLNMLSFFLLLGIACDDIFVLDAAWRQAVEANCILVEDYRRRLRYALPRAGISIFTTSITTAVAFFGNVASGIPPLKLFGIFSGFMVIADFMLTMLFLPSVLVLQHHWIDKRFDPTSRRAEIGLSCLDAFFAHHLAPRIFKVAVPIVLVSALAFTASTALASQIPPGTEWHNSDLFPKEHNQARSWAAQQAMVVRGEEHVTVNIVFGLLPESDGTWRDPTLETSPRWDSQFDFFAPGVQQFTLDLCNELLANADLVMRLNSCWALNLQKLMLDSRNGNGIATRQHLSRIALKLPGVYPDVSKCFKDRCEIVNYMVIKAESTLTSLASVSEQRYHFDKWESFMIRWREEAKRRGVVGLARGYQTSSKWVFMSTVENLASSCGSAALLSIGSVVIVMLFILRNIAITLLVLLHVIGICSAVVSAWVLQGRCLGVLESISMTLIIGLCVDYLAHLAMAYWKEPKRAPRELRTLGAIAKLGAPILSSAATTIMSTGFLCFASITLFAALGSMMVTMISLSFAGAIFSFTATLYLFGPAGDFCSLGCGSHAMYSPLDMDLDVVDTSDRSPQPKNPFMQELLLPRFSKRLRYCTLSVVGLLWLLVLTVLLCNFFVQSHPAIIACPEHTELEFSFENHTQAAKVADVCQGFEAMPNGCSYYVSGFEPIDIDEIIWNSTFMFASTAFLASSCPAQCSEIPSLLGVDALWTGSVGMQWPRGMAYHFVGSSKILYMHRMLKEREPSVEVSTSVNQQPDRVLSRGGIRLKLTPKPEQVLTSLIVGLHPYGEMWLAPGQHNVTAMVECTPRLLGNITIIAFAAYGHHSASRIVTQVLRAKQGRSDANNPIVAIVGDIGRVEEYTFDAAGIQKFGPMEYRHLKPGDTLRIFCSYDTVGLDQPMVGGSRFKEDAACMVFAYAYPMANIQDRLCLSSRAEIEDGGITKDEWEKQHPRHPEVTKGACISVHDRISLNSTADGIQPGTLPYIAMQCSKTAYSVFIGFNKDKFLRCWEKRVGTSRDCSSCFARISQYSIHRCKSPCLFSWCSRKCFSCSAKYEAELIRCTGLSPDERPVAEPCE